MTRIMLRRQMWLDVTNLGLSWAEARKKYKVSGILQPEAKWEVYNLARETPELKARALARLYNAPITNIYDSIRLKPRYGMLAHVTEQEETYIIPCEKFTTRLDWHQKVTINHYFHSHDRHELAEFYNTNYAAIRNIQLAEMKHHG